MFTIKICLDTVFLKKNSLKEITSTQNTYIKQVLRLKDKSKERQYSGLFIIEGIREIQLAIKGGYTIDTVLFNETLLPETKLQTLFNNYNNISYVKVSESVYQKIAYRSTTEGIIAIAKTKDHTLKSLQLEKKNPLILVTEAPEKPGNIGALLRTADAANLDCVIIANPKTDLYNPNIIRSSIGCLFTTKIAMATSAEIISYLKEKKITIYCAALNASKNYSHINYTNATAIVVGTEATGLTDEWLNTSHQNIIIPMKGNIDSMNVSVAAAIIIFEAKRQRELISNRI